MLSLTHRQDGEKAGIRARIRRFAGEFARALWDSGPEPEASWKKEFRSRLFLNDKSLVGELKISPEKVLYAATLLLSEDFRVSAGFLLINAAREKADISVAVHYLAEGMDSKSRNLRGICSRAMAIHHLNRGDFAGLKSVAERGDTFVRRDVFDLLNVYATDAHEGVVRFLADSLSHPDRNIRDFAVSALELAVELGDSRTRDVIRDALGPLTRTEGVPNIAALGAAEKILRAAEQREKRAT